MQNILTMKRVQRVKTKTLIHEFANVSEGTSMCEFIQSEITKKPWIYKIISGEKEHDQIIYECDDFIVLPDTEAPNEQGVLNWMVIFTDNTLTSLRSLRGSHVPLLTDVYGKLMTLLPAEYDSPMIYFHYPPSVWQLHLHVAAPCDLLRTTNSMQKVYFVEDVISNLMIDSDYYKKATLTYILPSTHELCAINNEAK